MVKALHGQGMGRHTPDEINHIGTSLIASISDFMGDDGGPFFLGAQPSSFDATVYAFLTSLMDAPFSSRVKDEANARRNLRAYVDRIKAEYWSQ